VYVIPSIYRDTTSTTKVTPRPVVPTKIRLFGDTGATAVVNFIASPMGTNNIYNTVDFTTINCSN
jgi:hypothetical protein